MKRYMFAIVVLTALAVLPAAGARNMRVEPTQFVVVYAQGASLRSARAAVRAAGGTIVKENAAVGVATVLSANGRFVADAADRVALLGAARNVPIGEAPNLTPKVRDLAALTAAERADVLKAAKKGTHAFAAAPAADPLAGLQWDMTMIHATAGGSYGKQPGDKGVLVGILDTGVDGTHPDIAPNFDAALSRNFVTGHPGDRRRRASIRAASTRRTRTTAVTARTSPARSAPRSTGSGSPVSPRT